MGKAIAAVIFDRDGVLNVDHGYVGSPDRFEWTPGARAAVARLNRAGIKVIVVTNQSGVARGYYDLASVDALHAHMQAQLAAEGARIDAFYACPFHAEAVVEAFRHPDHPDRKPNPGMILRALADFALDPAAVLLIGDQDSDLEAARRAGVRGVKFEGGDLDAFVAALVDQELPKPRHPGQGAKRRRSAAKVSAPGRPRPSTARRPAPDLRAARSSGVTGR